MHEMSHPPENDSVVGILISNPCNKNDCIRVFDLMCDHNLVYEINELHSLQFHLSVHFYD